MRVQITNGMFMALIINLVYAKAIGVTQSMIVPETDGDMWVSTTLASLQGMIMMLITVLIIRRAPTKDIMEQASAMLGPWAGKLAALLLFLFYLGAFGGYMITFVYHLMDYFLPDAPVILFVAVAMVVGVYGTYHGLEVMGRMAYVGLFGIILLNILIMLGTLPDFDLRNVMPVFDDGVMNAILASRHSDTDWASATLMASLILPNVKSQETWGKSSVMGIGFGWLFVIIWPILEAGVLSSEVVKQYFVACMQLARSAHLGNFIQRYELIMVAFFGVTCLVQIMMGLFCASQAVSKIFNLKDYRPAIIPSALILGGLGYWVTADHLRAHQLLYEYWPMVALPIAVGLPFSVWGLGFVMSKSGKARE